MSPHDKGDENGPHGHRTVTGLEQYGALQSFRASLDFQFAGQRRHGSAESPHKVTAVVDEIPSNREERDHTHGKESSDHQRIGKKNKVIRKVQEKGIKSERKNEGNILSPHVSNVNPHFWIKFSSQDESSQQLAHGAGQLDQSQRDQAFPVGQSQVNCYCPEGYRPNGYRA